MAKTLKKLFDWDEYGRKVLSGEIVVCKQIKQGVQKHYADLKASPGNGFVFSEERAQYAIQSFLFVKHSKGKFAGQQFIPSLWQQFWVAVAFGWMRLDGTRRYREVYLEVGRKNGKTTLLVALINLLKEKLRIGVMEADIDARVDADKVHELTGVKTIELHTGGACHLDAKMCEEGLDALGEGRAVKAVAVCLMERKE